MSQEPASQSRRLKSQSLKEMPVVSMSDGTKIGNIHELLFETTDFRLVLLQLAGAGGNAVLPFSAVRSFGQDVITVENVSVTQGLEGNAALGNVRGLRDLIGLRVINGEGTWIGDVREIQVNGQDGRVEQLDVHRGGFLGLGGKTVAVPVAEIRGIGPKVITVDQPSAAGQSSPA